MTNSSRPLNQPDSTTAVAPVRVLHIGKYFYPYVGGMETYLRDLLATQRRQGIETSAIVHQSELTLKSTEETYATNNQSIPIVRAGVWARLLFTPISPTFPWLLNKMIKRQKPDVLHLHMPNVSAFWTLFIPSARRLPWVIHWHSDVLASRHNLGLRIFYWLYRPFETAVLKHSRYIVATSPPYLESSVPLRRFRAKCKVVPLGQIPYKSGKNVPGSLDMRSDNLRVLAVGRLTYYKGFEYLIQAISGLDNVELHIVGSGDLESDLRQLSKSLNVGRQITFHGKLSIDDLHHQIELCDCLCLPSIERTEAFGMVILEAMSNGKATIVSQVPGSGMGWVVEDGVTGMHVPPGNSSDLAHSLRYLRDNRDKIDDFGAKGLERFNRLFNIEHSSSMISGIYRQALWPLQAQEQYKEE